MPRLTTLISLVSLISLASIARCRPVWETNSEGFFYNDDSPNDLSNFYKSEGVVPETPQESSVQSFGSTSLNVPLDTVSDYYLESMGLDTVGAGGSCRVPSLFPSCCPSGSLGGSGCVFGTACLMTDVSLCCESSGSGSGDGTPTNCEPHPEALPVADVGNFDDFNDLVKDTGVSAEGDDTTPVVQIDGFVFVPWSSKIHMGTWISRTGPFTAGGLESFIKPSFRTRTGIRRGTSCKVVKDEKREN